MRHIKSVLAAGMLCMLPVATFAQDVAYPWILHVGAHDVSPSSNTGRLAGARSSVSSDSRPTISLEYRFTPAWSVEALTALPFQHDVRLGGQTAASVKQLPPVIGVNYRFMPDRMVTPFVGVGANYTHFFSAKGQGALQGAKVDVDDSWGIAWHAGVDVNLDDRVVFTLDARYMDIDSKVKVNGGRVGTVHVDPWVYGFSLGYRF